jgi:hypothetical protein
LGFAGEGEGEEEEEEDREEREEREEMERLLLEERRLCPPPLLAPQRAWRTAAKSGMILLSIS